MTHKQNKVLIVDDSAINLKLLSQFLIKAHFEVMMAKNGASAITQVKNIKPDIILLDIIMPGMDGFETCRCLKANEASKDIPVIFMTALGETPDKVKGFEIGAVDYITKPAQMEEVLARINTHLTIRHLQNRLLEQNEYLKQEIIKRQQAEEELRKFARAVEQSASAIIITDIKGTIEYINPAFSLKTGYSASETIGKNPKMLSSGKQSSAFYQELWATIQSGQTWKGELINKRKNGELYWCYEILSPIKNKDDETTHYLAIEEDITERKQIEEQLRKFSRAVEQSANMIMITDINGIIEFVNPIFFLKTGYSPDEVIGQNPRFLNSGHHPPEFFRALWATLQNGQVWQGEMLNKNKNGDRFWEFATISPIKDKTGKITHYVAIKEDITERKRVNELIRQLFGRYLSDEVVTTLLETDSGLSLGGERREITVLTSDIRGFTAQSEQLLPEQVIKIINHYFAAMIDVISQYQGTINEFMGDGILVLFGAPIARADDPERAVACAVAMQLAMKKVNKQIQAWGFAPLEMGIGINTGDVVVGNIGSEKRTKYGVLGSEVNLTYRIESYSVGGQILISESTLKKVSQIVKIQSEKIVKPKGVTHPIPIYEVQGIAGQYNLYCHPEQEVFLSLSENISFHYTIVDGKHVSESQFRGHLVKLSAKSALIYCDVEKAFLPEPLSNIKLNFFMPMQSTLSEDIYAKVLRQAIHENHLYIQFTSVPMKVKAQLAELYESVIGNW
jgi:PAS domain S-box-containing protein